MTRLLEIIVALILVFIAAVVVGVFLPSHGHVESSLKISHNLRHTYDVVNNFQRFDDYSAMTSLDPGTTYSFSGPAYGEGAKVAWDTQAKIGDGSLTIASNQLDKQVAWALDNAWKGTNKHFTVTLDPSDDRKLINITMSYDVDYGWNLIARYSQMYLGGLPTSFMQYTLGNLQNVLAHVPNIDYKELQPVLVDTQRQPVLQVSTESPRTLDDIAMATDRALKAIHEVMEKLGLEQAGRPAILTRNWGNETYAFDVAVPIGSTKLTIDGTTYDLLAPPAPEARKAEASVAKAASAATAGSAAKAGSAAATGMAASADKPEEGPGTFEEDGTLTVTNDVVAKMAFKHRALMATMHGSPAGLTLTRLGLKAYASTHGYDFNEYAFPLYSIDVSAPDNDTFDMRDYEVYLPVSAAPEKTPWQIKHPEKAAQIISGEHADEKAVDGKADSAGKGEQAADTQAPELIETGS